MGAVISRLCAAETAETLSVVVLYDTVDEGTPTRHAIVLQP